MSVSVASGVLAFILTSQQSCTCSGSEFSAESVVVARESGGRDGKDEG